MKTRFTEVSKEIFDEFIKANCWNEPPMISSVVDRIIYFPTNYVSRDDNPYSGSVAYIDLPSPYDPRYPDVPYQYYILTDLINQ